MADSASRSRSEMPSEVPGLHITHPLSGAPHAPESLRDEAVDWQGRRERFLRAIRRLLRSATDRSDLPKPAKNHSNQ